jgi:tetratricopeptide (TPR) repeat protein
MCAAPKMTVRETLKQAFALQQSGRLTEAEQLYRATLKRDPDNADAWHLLGRIALQHGDLAAAAAQVREAIRRRPNIPAFPSSLGEILQAQGEIEKAQTCYQEALRLAPDFAPALVNLGNTFQSLGQYDEACIQYGRAIRSKPDCVEAYNNLANALLAQGRREAAIACYREALRLAPDQPQVETNLATALTAVRQYAEAERWARQALQRQPRNAAALSALSSALANQQRYEEAEEACRQALETAPHAANIHSNLGAVLLRQGRLEKAEACCRKALEIQSDWTEATNNLGGVLHAQGLIEEAAAEFEKLARVRPGYAEAWTNLGSARDAQGRPNEAIACYSQALLLAPDHAKARLYRALDLLLLGKYVVGFAEMEARWRAFEDGWRAQAKPAWDGSPLEGKTILLFAEQGLGDTIQFARYAPLVAARGGRVIMECAASLAGLMASVDGVSEVVTAESELPAFDVEAALMSLPMIFGTTPRTIPSHTPYLRAEPERAEFWRQALGPARGLRVGLAWAGNPRHVNDLYRSIDLKRMAELRHVPGVEWHSLQIGEKARAQVEKSGGWLSSPLPDTGDCGNLAALMCSLDLIVSMDSMPAHLAGALGRPVWTLLPWAGDWRWQRERDDSPWYPSMRLFRQPQRGDWETVIQRVAEELRKVSVQAQGSRTDMQ